ncbi:lithostathine-1-alpha-like [Mytilus californianus]|uniref:lithostathine-1-alpha-like n=1 Tax=Mytilus californianus TaxID=6549 RepID=UPI0022486232|nr:lithostathine-1-alpha-like [Mytilus californianus]
MIRVAMITLLVVICTALIVEAKAVHRRKRNSESPRLKRAWDYYSHLKVEPPDATKAPITKLEQGACKEGWRLRFGYCYYVSDYADIKSQSEAIAACKKLGAELYWPMHTYENFWLVGLIRMKITLSTFNIWTIGKLQNGKWGWGTGKPAFEDYRWLQNGQPTADGDCITIFKENGLLDNKPCETKFNYVCKTKQ